ncbi:hypothetical protein RhiirA1_535410 [Rhizophagus irregularis]|uniref:Uncharacterized protein n=1 Tax=Rhizophagus irregularis TaxID=588596 RepID=A0A2I1EFQ6_9GLOM|nr:hypothetical protein RhiirA1_535410 [Rhizophagus irregularis]PKY20978.1 hypothetical protein RhiirB3_524695 [Rhizophagus irregularis]
MSCSKIFLGDLPELTYEIIKYFQNDYSTLYSCIFVNRLWCRLAIPLLWENPFSIRTGNYDFIEIYLYNNLNNDLKLYEYKTINNSLLPTNTLFNYPSFLKYLNTYKLYTSVDKWFCSAIRNSKFGIGTDRYDHVKRLVHMSLFKIFIESEVNLHTLEIEALSIYDKASFNEILELILQNQNFIHNIGNMKLYTRFVEDNIYNNHVLQMIHLHQNLKKIFIYRNYLSLYQSLLLSKDYNCSNTLNTIIFYYINFRKIINLDEIFEQLNVLESVHIVYCYSLNNSFIQQINNLTKPFKLKSLILCGILQIESLQQLLLKSGDYLENFGGSGICYNYCDLLQLTKYCNNINLLYLNGHESEITILQKINLIESIKQSLNYLIINICEDSAIYSSIILENLGQILPSKLDYVNLSFIIKDSYFRVFLENSQYIFINKFLIKLKRGSDDILHYIKEYIMKEKRVKYLVIQDNNKRELFYLKDEVKEFELHNIIVRRHSDLVIDFDDLIWNIEKKDI